MFNGIEDENLIAMLSCLDAKVSVFEKRETIATEGVVARCVGIVLSGTVQLERTDYYGNRSIIASVEPSELFGESYACTDLYQLPFSIIAAEKSEIMLIDCQKIIYTCSNSCNFHNQTIFNLLKIIATKNIMLNQKAEITAKRTTREKLMAYLLMQSKKNQSQSFTISFDRQELADFLEVDRSGLSAEISKLRNEGVLESRKNWFKLL